MLIFFSSLARNQIESSKPRLSCCMTHMTFFSWPRVINCAHVEVRLWMRHAAPCSGLRSLTPLTPASFGERHWVPQTTLFEIFIQLLNYIFSYPPIEQRKKSHSSLLENHFAEQTTATASKARSLFARALDSNARSLADCRLLSGNWPFDARRWHGMKRSSFYSIWVASSSSSLAIFACLPHIIQHNEEGSLMLI